MGGCATKPKVLKDREGDAPEPVPESVKEEVDGGKVPEAKDVVVVDQAETKFEGDGDHEVAKVKEIVEDGKVDDQESKPRSLSNLFKTKEGQDSTVVDNGPSESVKEEPKETEKPIEESETEQSEAVKSETPVEQTAAQEFVDAPEKPLTEKATNVTPATETETEESSEKNTEDAKPSEKKTEDAKTSEEKTEVVESAEKKTEEDK